MSRYLKPFLLLAAVGALLLWLARTPPVEIEAAAVRAGTLETGFREEGRTRAREPFLLSAPVAGHIDRIVLEPGAKVAAGEVLVRLRPGAALLLDSRTRAETSARARAAQAAVSAAGGRVRALAAELAQARADARRLSDMADVVALAERDRAASRVRMLEAEQAAARAETERARNEAAALEAALAGGDDGGAALLELQAPIAGVVLVRHLQSAQPVAAGQPLLELAALEDLEAEIEVLSEDAVRLRPDGAAVLTRWGGSAALAARVRLVEPSGYTKVSALGVEEQRTRVHLQIDTPPAQRPGLGVGYRVEAWFVLERIADALIVPGSALVRDAQGLAVYRVADGVARRTPVQLRGENDEEAAVSGEGLAEGMPVVAHPDDRVVDGTRVRVVQ